MSFDRVAEIYDATRGLPPGAGGRVADQIETITHASHDTNFLEMGVGTGRIALPLISRGYRFIGVDISTQMMQRLRDKMGNDKSNVQLIEGDITAIQLPDSSIDAVILVHILHLVPGWREALAEAHRLLRPGGFILEGRNDAVPGDPGDAIRTQWRTYVDDTGTEMRPQYGSRLDIQAELTRYGYWAAEYRIAQWDDPVVPIEMLTAQVNRVCSATWTVPDEVLAVVHERMVEWCSQKYGDITQKLPSREEFSLVAFQKPL